MKKCLLLLFITVNLPFLAFSQAESYGTWMGVSLEKKLKKWEFGAETELRTVHYVRLIERWSLGVSADYDIIKPIKIGLGYQLMNKLDTKYLNYQWRNRFNASVQGKLKAGDFSFTMRERIQTTFKDESKRIEVDRNGNVKYLPDGSVNIDHYKMNPEWSWRNRLKMSYNIPNCKLTPSISAESFYQLNNPDGNRFDNFRYILSFEYKLNKRNFVEAYGVLNSELDSEDSYGKYILGLSYKYVLK